MRRRASFAVLRRTFAAAMSAGVERRRSPRTRTRVPRFPLLFCAVLLATAFPLSDVVPTIGGTAKVAGAAESAPSAPVAGEVIWDLSRVPDREKTRLEFPDLIRFRMIGTAVSGKARSTVIM